MKRKYTTKQGDNSDEEGIVKSKQKPSEWNNDLRNDIRQKHKRNGKHTKHKRNGKHIKNQWWRRKEEDNTYQWNDDNAKKRWSTEDKRNAREMRVWKHK